MTAAITPPLNAAELHAIHILQAMYVRDQMNRAAKEEHLPPDRLLDAELTAYALLVRFLYAPAGTEEADAMRIMKADLDDMMPTFVRIVRSNRLAETQH
jgi:hypothetical protein